MPSLNQINKISAYFPGMENNKGYFKKKGHRYRGMKGSQVQSKLMTFIQNTLFRESLFLIKYFSLIPVFISNSIHPSIHPNFHPYI